MRLIDADALKKAFEETVCIEPMPYAFVKQIIDNAPTVEPEPYFEKAEKDKRIYERGFEDGQNARPQGKCRTCRHRDPEDKKCDCGGKERQGCPFPVSDDYFCKFYEKGGVK